MLYDIHAMYTEIVAHACRASCSIFICAEAESVIAHPGSVHCIGYYKSPAQSSLPAMRTAERTCNVLHVRCKYLWQCT